MSDNIPIEVQMDIIRRLSVKSVAQCRTLFKTWRSCIDTMHFTIQFGDRFKGCVKFLDKNLAVTIPIGTNISFSGLTPVGWSHGLWGISFGPIVRHFMGLLWNPSVEKSVGAYVPYLTLGQEYEKRLLGFGVHPDNLDPIILKIAFLFDPTEPWTVHMFTLSSREWRLLENHLLLPQSFRVKKASQANIGRHIYWCGLGDNLVISGNIQGDDRCVFCIWVLSVVGETISSFSNLLSVPSPMALKLVAFHDHIDPIVEVLSQEGFSGTLALYRMASREFQSLGIEGDAGSFVIKPYCESLLLQSHVDRTVYCQELVYPGLANVALNLGHR
ncbi:F-box domain-containing protein [Artemisia annua]|uniref:F-box domain-containing protein n=1 Tax=Artemisia annua TaxID=35608 RepID=A0A2U1N2Y7_ARTAN|nr:F-box domain-containing protein [Artemisia annua]